MPLIDLTQSLVNDNLRDAADAHLRAVERADNTRRDRDDAIRDALDNGLPYRVVSKLTGLSRQQLTRIKDTAPTE
jgi:DNA invertase Pin-like site-specific DNA recombinase